MLAKLSKALYMYDMENSEYSKEIEGLLISYFRYGSDKMTKEDVYNIVLTYTMTR